MLGLSWGGALAQQFALQNPRRCRRLVLVATATGALMVPGRPRVLAKMLTPHRFTDADYAASIAGEVWTSLPVLPLIRQRTLIVADTDDPITPVTNAHIMKTLLPHAILHTRSGARYRRCSRNGHCCVTPTPQSPEEHPSDCPLNHSDGDCS